MLRELVAIHQQLVGPEHPETLRGTLNLALSLSEQNKYDEALILQRECYRGFVREVGARHPDTLLAATRNSISWDKSAQLSDFSENVFPGAENEKDTGFERLPVALGQRNFHIRFPQSRSNFRILISLKRLESNQKSVHIQLDLSTLLN